MRFSATETSREGRYAIGIEEDSGRHFLSIPVSNRLVDYEEYYEIDATTYRRLRTDHPKALAFADSCRRREQDHRLMVRAGTDRGTPM